MNRWYWDGVLGGRRSHQQQGVPHETTRRPRKRPKQTGPQHFGQLPGQKLDAQCWLHHLRQRFETSTRRSMDFKPTILNCYYLESIFRTALIRLWSWACSLNRPRPSWRNTWTKSWPRTIQSRPFTFSSTTRWDFWLKPQNWTDLVFFRLPTTQNNWPSS
jgi:hypothetical protein